MGHTSEDEFTGKFGGEVDGTAHILLRAKVYLECKVDHVFMLLDVCLLDWNDCMRLLASPRYVMCECAVGCVLSGSAFLTSWKCLSPQPAFS